MSKVGFLRISHWLAFVFDFVNTTDYCKQQVASVAPRLQQLTTPAVRRRSCSVYNSCGLTPRGCVNPLIGTGNYNATSNNMKLVHWPLMGGLLH